MELLESFLNAREASTVIAILPFDRLKAWKILPSKNRRSLSIFKQVAVTSLAGIKLQRFTQG